MSERKPPTAQERAERADRILNANGPARPPALPEPQPAVPAGPAQPAPRVLPPRRDERLEVARQGARLSSGNRWSLGIVATVVVVGLVVGAVKLSQGQDSSVGVGVDVAYDAGYTVGMFTDPATPGPAQDQACQMNMNRWLAINEGTFVPGHERDAYMSGCRDAAAAYDQRSYSDGFEP